MGAIDWASLSTPTPKSGGKKTDFVKFEDGNTYTVRPVGKGVQFCKIFVRTPNGNRSICVDIEHKDEAAKIISAKTGNEVKPQERYAINVIDRSDNSIRVMEGGSQIFKPLAIWAKGNNTAPGGNAGGDWLITVEGKGGANNIRRYSASFLRPVPLSADELVRVKDKKELFDLEKIFKSVPIQDVIKVLFGQSQSRSQSSDMDEEGNVPELDLPKQAPVGASVEDPAMW